MTMPKSMKPEGSHAAQAASDTQRSDHRASDREDRRESAQRHETGDATAQDERAPDEHGEGLSRSTLHAKWINSVDEHEDYPGQTLATRNHDVIRQWAAERNARPATVPGGDPKKPRVLRFDFPGYAEGLVPVDWNDWFRVFDERQLVFIYQEHLKSGRPSNFFRLDNPQREDA
jgi:hypothetical protein